MSGLPPRQIVTPTFPVIGERDPEPFDPAVWRLEVTGLVERTLSLTLDEVVALPRVERSGTIHCVTRWSRPGTAFTGVAFETVRDLAVPTAGARFVRFVSGRGHDTSLPIERSAGDVLLAYGLDGGPMPPGHGGPLRSVTFARYLYKSVKWLRRIEFLAEDRLGFWERTAGYHNGADPWTEERYVVRGVDRGELRRILAARDLSDRDLLGAPLRGADLRGMRLCRASLRNADLAGADLTGADLTDAHLTNANLRGAVLRDAVLDRTDIEGADLRGADLRGATGFPSGLVATQFVGDDGTDGAKVDGLDWSGSPPEGMIPSQVRYLVAHGVLVPPGASSDGDQSSPAAG